MTRVSTPILLALLLASVAVNSRDVQPSDSGRANSAKLDSLLLIYNKVVNKAGISFGGEFRSEFYNAGIDGLRAYPLRPENENVAYVTADIDLRARPHAAAQGRAVMRLHTDWHDVWTASKPSFFTRWLSIDGNLKDLFTYDIGDFRQQFTPLTLYAPELNILYEPDIFAADREMAMAEEFLGNHDRILQGLNLSFDSKVSTKNRTILDELHVTGIATRLRHPTVQEIFQGINGYFPAAFEKYLVGANGSTVFLRGVNLGGSILSVMDRDNGSRLVRDSAALATALGDTAGRAARLDSVVNLAQIQRTLVTDVRASIRLDSLLGASKWRAGAAVEFAHAQNTPHALEDLKPDSIIRASIVSSSGNALSVTATGGLNFAVGACDASAGFISNDPDYLNELAQSPGFVGTRIMNIENDSVWNTGADPVVTRFRTPQYSTFDALYRHVFRFAPKSATFGSLTGLDPFTKNSYTRAVMTQYELQRIGEFLLDPSLQLVMPFGPATPNRSGLNASLNAKFLKNHIEVKGLFSSLGEIEASLGTTPTAFLQYGAGALVDISGLAGWKRRINVSGSIVASSADNDSASVTSIFINAGATVTFWKRAALLGGFQRIDNTMSGLLEHHEIQTNLGLGLEYRVGGASYVSLKVVKVLSDDPSTSSTDLDQTILYSGMRMIF